MPLQPIDIKSTATHLAYSKKNDSFLKTTSENFTKQVQDFFVSVSDRDYRKNYSVYDNLKLDEALLQKSSPYRNGLIMCDDIKYKFHTQLSSLSKLQEEVENVLEAILSPIENDDISHIRKCALDSLIELNKELSSQEYNIFIWGGLENINPVKSFEKNTLNLSKTIEDKNTIIIENESIRQNFLSCNKEIISLKNTLETLIREVSENIPLPSIQKTLGDISKILYLKSMQIEKEQNKLENVEKKINNLTTNAKTYLNVLNGNPTEKFVNVSAASHDYELAAHLEKNRSRHKDLFFEN